MSALAASDLRRIADRLTILTREHTGWGDLHDRITEISESARKLASEHERTASLGPKASDNGEMAAPAPQLQATGTLAPPTLTRTVTIEQHSYDMAEDVERTVPAGWRIVEGTRSIDGLGWDEMLGQIATLTHHFIERGMSLFGGMKTAEEHAADRARHEAKVRKWAERADAKPAAWFSSGPTAAAPLLTSNDLALAEFAANLAMCWHRAQISSSFTQEEIAKLKRLIAKLGRAGRHLNPYPDSDDMPSDWGDDAVYGPLSKAVKP